MNSIDKLKCIIAASADPVVTDDEIDALLADAAIPDKSGRLPSDPEWEPTYDMNAAAAAGWMIKAARAAAMTESTPPGSGIVTSAVFESCRAMARLYAAKRASSANVR
jgi:hypothetical protein